MSQANAKEHAEDNDRLLYDGGDDAQPAADADPKPEENADADADAKKKEEEEKKKKEEEEKKKKEEEGGPLVPMPEINNPFEAKDDGEDFRSLNAEEGKPVFSQCCCCICMCHNKATDGESCCCVIPIKAGIMTIGVLTIVLAAVQISCQFFLMLNDLVAWWFPLVNLFLLIPTYIAASFFVVWFGKDCVSTRGRLFCGCIMVIVSTSLLAVWTVIYFVWIYKKDTVYYGWGTTEENYLKYQKKYYIFRELLIAVIIITAWAYFLCVTLRYSSLLKTERETESTEQYIQEKRFREKAQEYLDDKEKVFLKKDKEAFLAGLEKEKAKRQEKRDKEEEARNNADAV